MAPRFLKSFFCNPRSRTGENAPMCGGPLHVDLKYPTIRSWKKIVTVKYLGKISWIEVSHQNNLHFLTTDQKGDILFAQRYLRTYDQW